MIKTTRWSPDTCGCVLEFTWDSDVPADKRVHTPAAIINACAFHQGLSVGDHSVSVHSENQGKNKAIAALVAAAPELTKTDADGNVGPDLSKISFSFDEKRNVVFKTTGLKTDVATVQAAIDSAVGQGKVSLS